MAAVTLADSIFNTTAGNKSTAAGNVPAVGDLVVVIAASSGVTTTAVTDSQGGVYVQVDTARTGFSTTGFLTVWVRTSLVASATATNYTATQAGSTGGGLAALRVSGMTAVGAAAVRGTGGQSTGTAAATPAPVLSGPPAPANVIIGAVANGTNPAGLTPRASPAYTEHIDLGYATPATGLEVMSVNSGETSTTITWGGTSASAFASVVVELDTSTPLDLNQARPQFESRLIRPSATPVQLLGDRQQATPPSTTGALAGTTSPAAGALTGDAPYSPIQETFESYPTTAWAQSSTHGGWYVRFDGGGQVIPVDVSGSRTLQLESVTGLADPGGTETAASLVTSTTATAGDLTLWSRLRTVAQLRSGYSPSNTPNGWETAWLIWNYTEPSPGVRRFYYVALKTNGIELGKVDQSIALPGGQRFLFTDGTAFAVGTWYTVRVQQTGAQIQVWIDGTLRANFTDGAGSLGTPNWGTSGEVVMSTGAVGLYHEDARVQFDEVLASAASVSVGALAGTTPALSGAIPATVTNSGALAGVTSPASGALTGAETQTGALAGSTSPLVGALTSDSVTAGALAGSTSPPAGALTGVAIDAAALAAMTSPAAGALTGVETQTGALAGTTSPASGALTGDVVGAADPYQARRQPAPMFFSPPRASTQLAGDAATPTGAATGTLAATTSPAAGALTAVITDTGALAGATSPSAGALAGDVTDAAALAGTTSPASGALTGTETQTGALAGTLSPAVGTLTSSNVTTGALGGDVAPPVGALTATVVAAAAVAGTTSAAAAALAAGVTDAGALAGATSPAAGALTGTVTETGALAGTTSPAVGTLTSSSTTTGALATAAPSPATGALTATSYLALTVAGTTAPATGALTGGVQNPAAVGGTTPVLSGALAGVVRASGVLAGLTSPAYAELNRAPVIFYPLHPGEPVDNTGRYPAGAAIDNAARYGSGGGAVDNRAALLTTPTTAPDPYPADYQPTY